MDKHQHVTVAPKADVAFDAPSHVPGVQEGNTGGRVNPRSSRSRRRAALAEARRATSIHPEDHAPIDPNSPNLPPA